MLFGSTSGFEADLSLSGAIDRKGMLHLEMEA